MILTSKRMITIPPDSNEKGKLDYHFTLDELKKASHILKANKASGLHNLSNEMLACFGENYPFLVIKLFNTILDSNKAIPDWSTGMITPIFKRGSTSDPANCRVISLLSCFGKLFMSLLNNRLMDFCIINNIVLQNQLGFLPGNRTSDAHLIIHNLIQKHCHKNKSNIYSCFIDFSKAFDTIPRDKLLQKLLNYNIKGIFFNTIKNIYINDTACVKIKNKVTDVFPINQGVRQGCLLSPLLFNIFLSDLPDILDSAQNKANTETTHPCCLIWADYIILFSEKEDGLNYMLKAMEGYCKENELTVNTDKTKCIIFNKSGRLIRKHFSFNNTQLETVRSFKYLGFLITPSGEIKSGLNDLRDRTMKAFFKFKTVMGTEFNRNVQTTLSILDALIKPILLYCSDFWGYLKLPKDNPISKVHIMACKHILCVQKQTTNVGVLLELGRITLQTYAKRAAIKKWERIKSGQINPHARTSYDIAV